jgi:hypothetical protein
VGKQLQATENNRSSPAECLLTIAATMCQAHSRWPLVFACRMPQFKSCTNKVPSSATGILTWLKVRKQEIKRCASSTDLRIEGYYTLRKQRDEIGLARRCGRLEHK